MEVREKLPLSTIINASHTRSVLSVRVVFLAMLFTTFLLISNMTAFKIIELRITPDYAINFTAALVFFPLTYFVDTALTEVYGFKTSRLVIWGGLLCNVIVMLGTWLAVSLPPSPAWDASTHHGNQAYQMIFAGSVRVLFASILAYFFGEFLNAIALAKLKIATNGKKLYFRVMTGTAIGSVVDSMIFCSIAFSGIVSSRIIWGLIIWQCIFKIGYEFIMLPVTYWLTNYLKRADRVDYYDTETDFNPFSLKA